MARIIKARDGSSDSNYHLIKVRYGGRDNKTPSIYLPLEICERNQIRKGDLIKVQEKEDGSILITPYIPCEPILP